MCRCAMILADDGLWKINGRRQVIYAKSTLPIAAQLKAANRLLPTPASQSSQ